MVGASADYSPEFGGERTDRRRSEPAHRGERSGVRVIRELFRNSPTFLVVPVLTGLLFAFVGTITVAHSVQVLYERAFDQEPRGWRDIPRSVVWLVVLLGALVLESTISHPVRTTTGPVIEGLVRFSGALLFFWWMMHFLLAGRAPWHALIRPALVTAFLWLALAVFSSISLSSSIVSDSKLYGTIGVVFTLLTWFILVAAVLVLGAAFGAVWQKRQGQGFRPAHRMPVPSRSAKPNSLKGRTRSRTAAASVDHPNAGPA